MIMPAPGSGATSRPLALVTLLLALAACSRREASPPGGPSEAPPAPARVSDSRALYDLATTRGTSVAKRIEIFELILSDYPDCPETEGALAHLAQARANRMEVEEAVARYRELIHRFPAGPFNAGAHEYIVGYARRVLHDEEAAEAALRDAVRDLTAGLARRPDDLLSPAAIVLANCKLELEDWEGALETYRAMVQAPPSDDPGRQEYRITAQFHIGNVLHEQGRDEEARRAFEEARGMVAGGESLAPQKRDAMLRNIDAALTKLGG